MARQAWYQGAYNGRWKRVELTGLSMKRTGGPFMSSRYVEVQRRIFSIPLGTYWAAIEHISFAGPVEEEIYYDKDLEDDSR